MANNLWRRAALIAAATAGASALFAGVALADQADDDAAYNYAHDSWRYTHDDAHALHHDAGGMGGTGGRANATCAAPLGVSAGVFGQGDPVDECNVQSGAGGKGGTGVGS